MRQYLFLAFLVPAVLTSLAAAHGGRVNPVPTPAPPNTGARPVPPPAAAPPAATTRSSTGAAARYDWQTWWDHNQELYLAYRPPLHDPSPTTEPPQRSAPRPAPAPAAIRDRIVPALVEATRDPHHEVRSAAYIALGKSGLARLHRTVVDGLHDRHSQVRESCALALGLLGTPASLPVLRRVAAGRPGRGGRRLPLSSRTRAFATLSVGYSRVPAALDILREILDRRESARDVHAAALLALGQLGGLDVRRPLEKALVSRRYADEVRAVAAVALGKLENPEAVPVLLQALEDRSSHVRASAALALGAFRPTAPPELREITEIRRRLAAAGKAGFSPRARDVLAARLRALDAAAGEHHRQGERVRGAIVAKLHPLALGTTAAGNLAARNFAAVSLGRLGGPAAFRSLTHVLRNTRSPQVRGFACLGLAIAARERPGDTARRLLEKAFDHARTVSLRGAAAVALGILGQPEAAARLHARLRRTRDKELRSQLALALGMLHHRPAARTLRRLLRDEEHLGLRRSAALALGLMRDASAADILIGVLRKGRGRLVQGSAALALGYIGDRRVVEPLLDLLRRRRAPALSRAFAAVALGILIEGRKVPRLAQLAAAANYLLPIESLQEAFDIL